MDSFQKRDNLLSKCRSLLEQLKKFDILFSALSGIFQGLFLPPIQGNILKEIFIPLFVTWAGFPRMVRSPGSMFVKKTKQAVDTTVKADNEVLDFLVVDDINTILDPNSSTFDKTLAASNFIPVGKVIKDGRLVLIPTIYGAM